jgi:hypothetical protein
MKNLFLLTIIVCFISCQNNSLTKFYKKTLISDFPNSNYKYILIIPYAGCPGCVTNAEEFLIKEIKNNKYLFIITNYYSRKAISLKLGETLLKNQNILLDSTNRYFATHCPESIYPITIFIEKERIKGISLGLPE